MFAVFVDTWFLVASLNKFDADHPAAVRLSRKYHDVTFVTHDAVLTELLTFFSRRLWIFTSADRTKSIRSSTVSR